jgi:biopolymer transport protein ExbD
MEFERTRRRIHEINLTPLIDIVFHLMVFVMLTTTFIVSESMELSLPSGHAKGSGAGHIVRIQIAPDGGLMVDNQAMSSDGLSSLLASKLADLPNTRIAIFTTPGVSVQQLVNVMDTVYLTGGRNVQVDKVGE